MPFCDTCFLIDLLNGNEEAIKIVYDYPQLQVSSIAVAEFLYGIQRYSSRRYELAVEFINKFEHIPFNTKTAYIFAETYQGMKDQGLSLSILDAMIAATSIQYMEPLITRDTALIRTQNLSAITY